MQLEELADMLQGLAHPTRLKVANLVSLHRDGLEAGAISKELSIRKSTLSSHLAILVASGLVNGDRTGRNIVYRIDSQGVDRLFAQLGERLRSDDTGAKRSTRL